MQIDLYGIFSDHTFGYFYAASLFFILKYERVRDEIWFLTFQLVLSVISHPSFEKDFGWAF